MSGMTAARLYGHDPSQIQPVGDAKLHHQGAPEPVAATRPLVGRADTRLPVFALVVLVGAAIVLTQVSFRGEVSVRA